MNKDTGTQFSSVAQLCPILCDPVMLLNCGVGEDS